MGSSIDYDDRAFEPEFDEHDKLWYVDYTDEYGYHYKGFDNERAAWEFYKKKYDELK